MLIALLDFSTDAPNRPAALAHLDRESDEVRALPGNIAFRVYASRHDDTQITVVHEWHDEAAFAAYLASEVFARSGAVLRPLMNAPAVSRRFHADLIETVA